MEWNGNNLGAAWTKLSLRFTPESGHPAIFAGKFQVTMVTDDEDATAKVLKEMGRDFEANELILTTLSNEPGALAEMATKLSDEGINIISFYIMKMEMDAADVALTTDNPSKTKEILGI